MITADWRVIEVLEKYPKTYNIFKKYRITIGCCGGDGHKTLAQAALARKADLTALLNELNKFIEQN